MAVNLEGVLSMVDRASATLTKIRLEAERTDHAVNQLGRDLDKLGAPNQLRQMDRTTQSIRSFGRESQLTGQRTDSAGRALDAYGMRARRTETDNNRLSRSMRTTGRDTEDLRTRLTKLAGAFAGLGKIFGVIKWPAIVAGVGTAIRAVTSLTGATISLLPKITDLAGLAAPLITGYAAAGLAMGTFKLAMGDVTKALAGNAQAIKRLTPEGRAFVQFLHQQWLPALKQVREGAQRGLFPGLERALRTVKPTLPVVAGLFERMGRAMGGVAQHAAKVFATPRFLADFQTVGASATGLFSHIGRAATSGVSALMRFTAAGKPLTDFVGRGIERMASHFDHFIATARASGALDRFFQRTEQSMTRLGHITHNLFDVILNLFRAARPAGDTLWASIDKTTKRWADWTASFRGQNLLSAWFRTAVDDTRLMAKLFGDLFKAVFNLGQGGGGFASIVKSLDAMVPSLQKLIQGITTGLGPALGQALLQLAQLAPLLLQPLPAFTRIFSTLVTAVTFLLHHIPGLGTAMGGLLALLAFKKFASPFLQMMPILAAFKDKGIGGIIAAVKGRETAEVSASKAIIGAIDAQTVALQRYTVVQRESAAIAEASVLGPAVGGGPRSPFYAAPAIPVGPRSPFYRAPGQGAPAASGASTAEAVIAGGFAARTMDRLRGIPGTVRGAPGRIAGGIRGVPMMWNPETFAYERAAGGTRMGGLFGEGGLLRAGGAGRSALATGGRFVGQLALFNALMSGISTGGNAWDHLTGAVSGLSLGVIPGETPRGKLQQQGFQNVQGFLQRINQAPGLGGTQARIGAIQRDIQRQQGRLGTSVAGPWEQNIIGTQHPYTAQVKAQITALRRVLGQQMQELQQEQADRARQMAGAMVVDFGRAFDIRARHGGPVKAMGEIVHESLAKLSTLKGAGAATLRSGMFQWGLTMASQNPKLIGQVQKMGHGMIDQLRKLGPQGRQGVAQNMLLWAREQAKQNPKMQGLVDDLTKYIVSDFKSLGQNVKIVNGVILDGSLKSWSAIEKGITTSAEMARIATGKSFDGLMQEAVTALTLMGYNQAQARALVKGAGTPTGQSALTTAARSAKSKNPGVRRSGQIIAGQATQPFQSPHATGGRLSGTGLADTVRLFDGSYGAPGELILNRHTERDVNLDLLRSGRPTLGQRVAREQRPHSAPVAPTATATALDPNALAWRNMKEGILPDESAELHARGGRSAAAAVAALSRSAARNSPTVAQGSFAAMVAEANAIDARHYPYVWGGGHNGSFSGPYDCSGAVSAVLHAGGALSSPLVASQFMSFGSPGDGDVTLYASPGHVYMSMGGKFFGTSHANPGGGAGWFPGGSRPGFVHRKVAATGGGALSGAVAGGVGAAGLMQIPALKALKSGMKGVPGALADRAMSVEAAALTSKINAHLAAQAPAGPGSISAAGFKGGGSASANMALGHKMMLAAGWPESEWPSLQALWTQESGWNANAVNKSSGASGIPQALGHGHVFALGDAAAQIAWGLNYIRGRYGSPSRAEAHERSNNWYSLGGRMPFAGWFQDGTDMVVKRPTLFGAGEGVGPERVTIEPHRASATGRGGVRIGHIVVHNHRHGDIKKQIVDEVSAAFDELAAAGISARAESEEEVIA